MKYMLLKLNYWNYFT
jgi:hypothetical protein